MRAIKLIVSDLHVSGGDAMLDGFGECQQAALEGLLTACEPRIDGGAASTLGGADDMEFIFNGDCLDFQLVEPYEISGVIDASQAVEKLGKVIAAHGPFFETLGRFVRQPGRHITFMTGNHDVELGFAEVRAGIVEAMGLKQDDCRVYFCPTRSYRPLPDVYIEHGNAYDFWNHDRSGFWDASGHARTANPKVMTLPVDSQYAQHVAYHILARYPYLTLFEPALSIPRQAALICLLNPEVGEECVLHVQELIDAITHRSRQRLLPPAPGAKRSPVASFEDVVKVLLAFQREVAARTPGWKELSGKRAALLTKVRTIMEVVMLRRTLSSASKKKRMMEAIATIFKPMAPTQGDVVAAGIHTVLKSDPSLRFALAGHTHRPLHDRIKSGRVEQQVYLNTGSWSSRLAPPAPAEVTPELVAWLSEPNRAHIPLRDVPPQFVFALVSATGGEPSSARLCVWEGGCNGQYRVLAS